MDVGFQWVSCLMESYQQGKHWSHANLALRLVSTPTLDDRSMTPVLNDSMETETLYQPSYQPLWCKEVITSMYVTAWLNNIMCIYIYIYMIYLFIYIYIINLTVCVRVWVRVYICVCMYACIWRASFYKDGETHEYKPSVIHDVSQTLFPGKSCSCFYLDCKFVSILKHIS